MKPLAQVLHNDFNLKRTMLVGLTAAPNDAASAVFTVDAYHRRFSGVWQTRDSSLAAAFQALMPHCAATYRAQQQQATGTRDCADLVQHNCGVHR